MASMTFLGSAVALMLAAGATPPSTPLPVVAILPPRGEAGDPQALGAVIQDHASGGLDLSGQYAVVHLKQIVRMSELEGVDLGEVSDSHAAGIVAQHLGADRLVISTLGHEKHGWSLALQIWSPPDTLTPSEVVHLPEDWAAAVEVGGNALADAARHPDGRPAGVSLSPETRSGAAMRAYAECFLLLAKQPIGIESPTVLLEKELGRAAQRCEDALRLDPNFAEARAGLALIEAIRNDDAAAATHLTGLRAKRSYLPMGWLAWFWLRTRHESSSAGADVLRAAIAQDPALLLYRAFLAEHLNALRQQQEALAAWQEYTRVCPRSPLGLERVGYTLAKLGQTQQAIEETRRAIRQDPESRALTVDLANRQIDAGLFRDAIATLTPLVANGNAGPNAFLGLGYARLRVADLSGAEADLTRAISLSAGPREWRSRGRARVDLAQIAMQRGQPQRAIVQLTRAINDGYPRALIERDDPSLAKLLQDHEAAAPSGPGKEGRHAPEASPFSLSPAGEIQPDAPRPPPPWGFTILKF